MFLFVFVCLFVCHVFLLPNIGMEEKKAREKEKVE